MNDSFASGLHQATRPGAPVGLAKVAHRPYGLTTLRSMIATWSERIRFRWELEQKSKDNPHLIEDMGLTKRQVEAEFAKPFWRR